MAKKTKDLQYYEAVGRRKEAVARVRMYIAGKDKSATVDGKKYNQGQIILNKKPIEEVFSSVIDQKVFQKPLELTNSLERFVITISSKGGGAQGQIEAIVHGISRALCIVDKEEYRSILKKEGLLTRDPRTRERRMVGTGGKARRAKQSPKR